MYTEREIRENYRKLTRTLIEKNMTISTMESATGGLIASLITDTEGASAVLKGAFVTYCNEAKIMQGVPASVIDRYTVYSKETAQAMARACMDAYGADIGVGITGTMGNIDPENEEASEIGQVYFAIAYGGQVRSFSVQMPAQPTRPAYKLAAAGEVYDGIVKTVFCDIITPASI